MNKIYKLKFNQSKQQVVVVSELATNYDACASNNEPKLNTLNSTLSLQVHPSNRVTALTRTIMAVGFITSSMSLLGVKASAHTNPQVVAGSAHIESQGLVTTITNTPNTIINWDSFNISKDEIVKFVQQSSHSTVLNRVLGGSVSTILGMLQSNGNVFLINPNGIVFGKNAHVNVNSLIASTLDLKNQDFLNGKYIFNQTKDSAIASVINQGMIKVNDNGTLALIGGQSVNSGMLEAKNGTVYLLAGHSIEITDLNNPLISYKVSAKNKAVNLGKIVAGNVHLLGNKVLNGQDSVANGAFADIVGSHAEQATKASITASGEVELFGGSEADTLQTNHQSNKQVVGKRSGLAVNNGVINVANTHGMGGTVRVLADTVILDSHSLIVATGSTRGGTVNIGGDQQGHGGIKLADATAIFKGETINVTGNIDGGRAILWGGYGYYLGGNIDARGLTGKGGFVETSGKGMHTEFKDLRVNPGGSSILNGGEWLLDPENIIVLNHSEQWCPPNNDPNVCTYPFKFQSGVIGYNYPGALNLHYWKFYGPDPSDPIYGQWKLDESTWYLKDDDLSAAMTGDRSSTSWSPYNVTLSADKSVRFINANITPQLGFLGDTESGHRFLSRYYTHGLIININSSNPTTATEVSFKNTQLSTGYLVVNAKKGADIKLDNSSLAISSPRSSEANNENFGEVLLNTENGNITIANGSNIFSDREIDFNITGKGNVSIEDSNLYALRYICYTSSEQGSSFYLNNSSMVSYVGNITIHPTDKVTITNTTCISAQNIDINSSNTQIFNATVRANKDIKVHSDQAFTLNMTDFGGGVGQNDINPFYDKEDQRLHGIGASASQGIGNVTIDGNGDTHLIDSQITSVAGYVNLESHGGGFTSTNAKVLAKKGYVRLNTTKDIVFNNTQVVSRDDLQFNVKNANFTAYNGTNIEATEGSIKLVTDYKINITDSNLTASTYRTNKEIFIVSNQGTVLNNATLNASGLLNITSNSTQCITCSTLTGGSVNISIKDQDLVINTSNITSIAGNTTIFTSNTKVNNVNLTGVNVNAAHALLVRGKTININNGNLAASKWELSLGDLDTDYTNLTNVAVKTALASQADINIRGNKKINLKGNTGDFYSDRDLNLSSGEGQIYLSDKHVRVNRSINITAQSVTLNTGAVLSACGSMGTIGIHTTGYGDNGNLTVNGAILTSTISSQLISENSTVHASDVKIRGGIATIQANNAVTLDGNHNDIFGHGAVISSKHDAVSIASTNITSLKSSDSMPTKVEIYSPTKVTLTSGSEVNSSFGTTNITSADVEITGTKFHAKTETRINATTSSLNVTNVQITGGCATLISPKDISIGGDSVISLTEGDALFSAMAGGNVNITDSPLSYKKGNISAKSGNIDVTNSSLIATSDVNVLTAGKVINASASVIKGGIEIEARDSVNLTNSNVTDTLAASKTHTFKISAPNSIKSDGSNISAMSTINLNATHIEIATSNIATSSGSLNIGNGTATCVTVQNSHLETTGTNGNAGDININSTSAGTLCITGTTAHSSRDLNLSAPNVTLDGSQFNVTRAINITAQTITLQNASNLTVSSDTGTIGLHATDKGVTLNNSITSGNSIEIVSNTTSDINNNSLVVGESHVVVTGKDGVKVTDSNITATKGKVNLTTSHLTVFNSAINGQTGVILNQTAAGQPLTVENSTITGGNGSVEVTADQDVTLQNTSLTTDTNDGGAINVTTTKGNVTLANAPINAGDTVLIQGKEINGSADSTVIGKNKVTVNATTGNVTLPGATITSLEANTTVSGKTVNLKNSTVKGKTGVDITATTGNVSASGGTYSSEAGNVTLQAHDNVNFDNANASAQKGNISIVATTGNFSATCSTLTTPQGAIKVKVGQDIQLDNTSVVSHDAIDLSAINISAVNNSTLQATDTNAGLKLTASNNITLDHSNTDAQGDIVINATNETNLVNNAITSHKGKATILGKEVTLTSSPVTAQNDINVTATGNLTFTKSAVNATQGGVVLNAGENITGQVSDDPNDRSHISGTEVTINAERGNVQLPSANISATTGAANITAAQNVNLQDSGVIANKEIHIQAKDGNVSASNGTYQSNTSNIIVNATQDINFNNSLANASTGSILFNTTGGNFNATGSTIYAPSKGVEVSVAKDINLNHTNITTHDDLTLTANNINTSNNTLLNSTAGSTTLNATQHLNVTGTALFGNNITLTSQHDNVEVYDSNATTRTGDVQVLATTPNKKVTLQNFNTSAYHNVTVRATTITDTGSNLTTQYGEISLGDKQTETVTLTNTKLSSGLASPNDLKFGTDIGIHGNKAVTLTNVQTNSGHDLNLSSPNGKVEVKDGSALNAKHIINITAQNVTLENGGVTSDDSTSIVATNGNVTLSNAPVNAGSNITIQGQNILGSAGSQINATNHVNITATSGNVELPGANVTATTGTATINAKDSINLQGSNVTAGTGITITATDGNLTAAGGSYNSKAENVTLQAKQNVNLNDAKVCATTGSVAINATEGNLTATNSLLHSPQKAVSIKVGKDITLDNTNVTSHQDLTITAQNITTSHGTVLSSTQGATNVTANNELTLNGTSITGSNITLHATTGNITTNGTNATASNGDVIVSTLTPSKKVTLNHFNASAAKNVQIKGTTITGDHTNLTTTTGEIAIGGAGTDTVSLTNGELTTSSGDKADIGINATHSIILDHTNVTSGHDINLSAPTGTINTESSNLTASHVINITAQDVTLANGSIAATDNVSLVAKNKLSLQKAPIAGKNIIATAGHVSGSDGSILNATNDVNITATKGNVDLPGATIIAKTGTAQVSAKESINLKKSSIKAGKATSVIAIEGNLTATGGTYVSDTDNVTLSAQNNVNLNDATVCATTGSVVINATNGNLAASNTLLHAPTKAVSITVGKDITLNHSNITSHDDLSISATNVTTENGTSISSTTGNTNVTAKQELTLNSTCITGGNVTLTSTTGNIQANDTNVTATTGNVSVSVPTKGHTATLHNFNASAANSIKVDAPSITGTGGKLNATTGEISIGTGNTTSVTLTDYELTTQGSGAGADIGINATQSISLTNTQVNSGHDLNLSSPAGTVTTEKGSLKAKHVINVTAQDITIANGSVTAEDNVSLEASHNVSLNNAPISGKDIIVTGANVTGSAGSTLTATHDVNINATTGNVDLPGATITAEGNASVVAKQNVNLPSSSIIANNNLTLDAHDGTLTTTGGKYIAKTGDATLKAHNDVALNDATVCATTGNITVNATTGNLAASNTTLYAPAKAVNIKVGQNITLNHSNITSHDDLTLTASNIDSSNGTTIASTTGNTSVNATNNVTLKETSLTGNNITLTAQQGNILVEGSNATATAGNVTVSVPTAGKSATLNNFNATASDSIIVRAPQVVGTAGNLNATHGEISIGNGSTTTIDLTDYKLTTHGSDNNADIGLNATNSIKLTNTDVNSSHDINLSAPTGEIQTSNANLTAKHVVNLTANNITIADGTVTAGNTASIVATNNVALNNAPITGNDIIVTGGNVTGSAGSTLTATNNVAVTANKGNVDLPGAVITATSGNATVMASQEVNLANSSVVAGQEVQLQAKNGNLTASGGKYLSSKGNITIDATENVFLNDAGVCATTGNVAITATKGNLEVFNATIAAPNKAVGITVGKDINLNHTNISSHDNLVITAENITSSNNSQIVSTTGDTQVIAKQNLNLTATTVAGGAVNLTATTGNITVDGVNMSATSGNATITAPASNKVVTVANTNISANQAVKLAGSEINVTNSNLTATTEEVSIGDDKTNKVTLDHTNVTATKHDVNIHATTNVTLTNSNLTAARDVNLSSPAGRVALDHTPVTAGRTINITAKSIIIKADDESQLKGGNVSLTSTGANSMNLDGVTINASHGDAELHSPTGPITLNNSNITATHSVEVIAPTVTANSSNFEAGSGDIELGNASTTQVVVTNSSLKAPSGNVSIHGNNNVTIGNTTVNAGKDINLASPTGIVNVVDNSNLTAGRTINITAQDVNITNAVVNATQDVHLNATAGNLTVTDANVTSTAGNIALHSTVNTTISNVNVAASQNLTVTGTNITVTDTNLTATDGEISVGNNLTENVTVKNTTATTKGNTHGEIGVHGNHSVTLDNTSLDSAKSVNLSSPNGTVSVSNGSSLKAKEVINITAKDVTVTDTVVNATKDVHLNATAGNLTVTDTNVTSTSGNVALHSTVNTTISNVNVTANQNLTVTGTNITVTDANLTTTNGEISVGNNATENVTLTNTKAKTSGNQGEIGVHGNHSVNLNNTSLDASKSVNLSSPNGNVSVSNGSSLQAKEVINITAKDVTIKDAVVNVTKDVHLNATAGNLTVANTNVTSTLGNVALHSTVNTTISNVNVAAHENLTVTGTNITVTDTNLTATEGEISVGNNLTENVTLKNTTATTSGKDKGEIGVHGNHSVTLDNTSLDSAKSVNLSSPNGTVSVANSNLTAKEVINITAKDVTVTDTVVNATKDVHLNATAGNLTVANTNVTSQQGNVALHGTANTTISNVNIAANQNLTVTGTNITVTDTNLTATKGEISVGNNLTENVTLKNTTATTKDSTNGEIGVHGNHSVTLDNTSLDSAKSVNLSSPNGTVSVANSNLTAKEVINITAKDVTVTDTLVNATKDVHLNATAGNLTVANTNITSQQGNVALHSTVNTTLNNVNVAANQNLTVTGTNITVTDTNLTATQGEISVGNNATENVTLTNTVAKTSDDKGEIGVHGNHSVTLENTSLDSAKSVNLSSPNGTVSVANSNLTAKEVINITAKDVTVTNTLVNATKDVHLNATAGNLTVTNANVTSQTGNVALHSTINTTISNVNVAARENLTVTGKDITVSDTNLTATNGEISVGNNATENVTLTNTKAKTSGTDKGEIGVHGNHSVTLENTSLDSAKSVNLSSPNGNVSVSNGSSLKAKEVINITANNISISDTTVTAEKQVEINATHDVNITSTQVHSNTSTVNVTAGHDLGITNTNITAPQAITVHGDNDVTLQSSNLTSNNQSVNVTAGNNLTINNSSLYAPNSTILAKADKGDLHIGNGSNVTAKDKVTIVADNGNMSIVGTNVTSLNDNVSIQAKQNITITNSNISGKQEVTVTSDEQQVTLQDSKVNATNGNVTLNANKTITVNNTSLDAREQTVVFNTTHGDINIGNGSNVTAKKDINITSPEGNVSITGTNITSTDGSVTVKAKKDVSIVNSNISGKHDVTVTGDTGNVTLQDSKVNATTGNVTVTAQQNVTVNNTSLDARNGNATITATDGDIHIGNGTNITAKDNVNITAPKGSIDITGTNITSTDKDVNIKAKKDIAIVNSNISGKHDVTVTGETGNVTLQDSKVNATTGNVTVTAQQNVTVNNTILDARNGNATITATDGDVHIGNGTNITAKDNVNITAPKGSIDITGTNITSTDKDVNIKAKKDVSIVNSNISGKHDVTVTGDTGNVTLQDSKVNATTGNVNVTAQQNVTVNNTGLDARNGNITVTTQEGDVHIGNGTNITAKDNVNITAPKGSIDITGTNITSTDKDVNIKAKKDVAIVNSNISGKHEITVTGETGNVTLQDSKVNATTGNVTLNADKNITVNNTSLDAREQTVVFNTTHGDINIGNGSNITAKKDIDIISPEGNVSITGTNVTSTDGSVTVKAKKDVSIVNSNISGKHDVTVTGDTGNVTLQDSKVNATTGNVNVTAQQNVTVNNTSLDARNGNATIIAKEGDVQIGNGTNITAKDNVNITAPKGSIDITGTNITSTDKDVNIKAKKDVAIVNSNISGKHDVTVTGETGNVTLQDSKVNATTGNVNITAQQNVTVNNTSLDARDGNITVTAKEGDVHIGNGTNITAKDDVNITAPKGSIDITGTNITSIDKDVNITAKKDITIINSNITSKEHININTDNDIKIDGSNVESNITIVTAPSNITVTDSHFYEFPDPPGGKLVIGTPTSKVTITDTTGGAYEIILDGNVKERHNHWYPKSPRYPLRERQASANTLGQFWKTDMNYLRSIVGRDIGRDVEYLVIESNGQHTEITAYANGKQQKLVLTSPYIPTPEITAAQAIAANHQDDSRAFDTCMIFMQDLLAKHHVTMDDLLTKDYDGTLEYHITYDDAKRLYACWLSLPTTEMYRKK